LLFAYYVENELFSGLALLMLPFCESIGWNIPYIPVEHKEVFPLLFFDEDAVVADMLANRAGEIQSNNGYAGQGRTICIIYILTCTIDAVYMLTFLLIV
jgi:hypothetical protein